MTAASPDVEIRALTDAELASATGGAGKPPAGKDKDDEYANVLDHIQQMLQQMQQIYQAKLT
jgi:hypothetical protein